MSAELNELAEREAIARIIDPGGMLHPALPTEGLGPRWVERRNAALAKADAIIALRSKAASQ